MKCFQHEQVDAVAVCCACGRAVCAKCTLVTDAQHIVCSDGCQSDDKKAIASRAAVLELILATTRSYKGLVVVFNLLAAVLFLLAIASLFTPMPSTILAEDLSKWRSVTYGGAVVFAFLGLICIVGSRCLVKVTQRYDKLVKSLPSEMA